MPPPDRFKILLRALTEELRLARSSVQNSIQQSSRQQTDAIHDKAEIDREGRQKIQVSLSELRIPENEKAEERSQRKKEYTMQVLLCIGTCLAFFAAAVYAGIAYKQKQVMDNTLVEVRNQTVEARQAAYFACLNAQITQSTFVQLEKGAADSHAVAAANIEQLRTNFITQRASVKFGALFPKPKDIMNDQVEIPFSLKNEGKSDAINFVLAVKAVFVNHTDELIFKNLKPSKMANLAAGFEVPQISKDPAVIFLTPELDLVDLSGKHVMASSPDGKTFLNGGNGAAYVYGSMSYGDTFGLYESKFCIPIGIILPGNEEKITISGIKCSKYNQQETKFTALPKASAASTDKPDIQPIQCDKPKG